MCARAYLDFSRELLCLTSPYQGAPLTYMQGRKRKVRHSAKYGPYGSVCVCGCEVINGVSAMAVLPSKDVQHTDVAKSEYYVWGLALYSNCCTWPPLVAFKASIRLVR